MRDVNLASQDLSGTAFWHCPITHIFGLTNKSFKQELLQITSEIAFSAYPQKNLKDRIFVLCQFPPTLTPSPPPRYSKPSKNDQIVHGSQCNQQQVTWQGLQNTPESGTLFLGG